MGYVVNAPVADAVQFDGTNVQECIDFAEQWFAGFPGETATYDTQSEVITTARGYTVGVTDWLVGPATWSNLQYGGSAEIVSDALFQAKYSSET